MSLTTSSPVIGWTACVDRHDKETQMPRGPNGQKRPADVIANAIRVAEIAKPSRKPTSKGRR
jgi:hypothetical protein